MNNHTLQQMTLENIARACGGTYVGEDTLRGSEITGAVIDRAICISRSAASVWTVTVLSLMYLKKARWQFCLRNRWKIRQDRTFW